MLRRRFLGSIGFAIAGRRYAIAQPADRFDQLLAEAATDPDGLDAANAEREKFQAVQGEPSEAQSSYRNRKSSRQISPRARRLLITFEVSGQAVYEARYAHPTWPGGQSGVTIGIGYDLGYAKPDVFRSDWTGVLDNQSLATLANCCGVTGAAAHDNVHAFSGVRILWRQASSQFDAYLPYAMAQTEQTFPHCDQLSDDSFGGLVSLVYNRGPSVSPVSRRRREMREIFYLMSAQDFSPIPQKIRDMKHLWPNPSERGLIARRELEAILFEQGLRKT